MLFSSKKSLDAIGLKYGLDQSSAGHGYLSTYQQLLETDQPVSRIALLGATKPVATANAFAEFLPKAKVLLLRTASDPEEIEPLRNVNVTDVRSTNSMHLALARFGPVQWFIDDGTNRQSEKRNALRNLLMHLSPGGRYVIEDLHAIHLAHLMDDGGESVFDLVTRLLKLRLLPADQRGAVGRDDRGLLAAVGSVHFMGKLCVIEKEGRHALKIRDEIANRVLRARETPSFAEVIPSMEAGTLESRVAVTTNNAALEGRFRKELSYPKAHFRAYEGVTCLPGQVVHASGLVLPDSFRRVVPRRATNVNLAHLNSDFVLPPAEAVVALQGTYYGLDSEFPGHFGHFTSEVIARLWGWEEAKKQFPDVKALMALPPGKAELSSWQLDFLSAAGIGRDDIQILEKPTRVERFLGVTPLFSNPFFVNPALTDTWQRMGERLLAPGDGPDRIFVSRKAGFERRCLNADAVEQRFRDHGFEVVYPEDHPVAEQVTMFNRASAVAGYAGSGMFSLMFALHPKKVIVIGSESYDAVNEYLIASAQGGELTYFWCDPLRRHPVGGWDERAFHSDFQFDFDRDGALLTATLEALDR